MPDGDTIHRTAAACGARWSDVHSPGSRSPDGHLRALGPDLCDATIDIAAAAHRLQQVCAPEQAIGEVLLDQRVACGVGNVYRSEVAFLHGLDPAAPLGSIDIGRCTELLVTAATLLQDNLSEGTRTTVAGLAPGSLWVYGRRGRPCRRCATPIERIHLGTPARVAYRCPSCQPPVARTSRPPNSFYLSIQ